MSDQSTNDRSEPAGTPAPSAGVEEFRALVARARKGDRSAVPRLSQFVSVNPQLWHHYGNLGRQVRMAWIRLAAGNDLFHQQCLRWRAADMHRELVGGSKSRVVHLMAERVVLAWLQACYFDGIEVAALNKPEPLPLLNYRAKRGTQANRQFMLALAAFTTLRKLLPDNVREMQAAGATAPALRLIEAPPPSEPQPRPAAQPAPDPAKDSSSAAAEPAVPAAQPLRKIKRAAAKPGETLAPSAGSASAPEGRVGPRARAATATPTSAAAKSARKSKPPGGGSALPAAKRRVKLSSRPRLPPNLPPTIVDVL